VTAHRPDPAAGPAVGSAAPATSVPGLVPDSALTADPGPAGAARSPSRVRQVVSALGSLAVVIAIFWYFLPQYADISKVGSSVRDMTWLEVTTLVVVAGWNLATYLFVMVATMPGLTYSQAFVVAESSTAVANTVPAGGAIGIATSFGMFHSWGFSRSRISVSLLLTGIWNNFAKLSLPVLALALIALQGNPGTGRLIAGLTGIAALMGAIAVFALVLRSDAWAQRVGDGLARWVSALQRPLGRKPVEGWGKATRKFRSRTILLLRSRWRWLTLATLVSHLSLFLVLLLSLRHIGVSNREVSWAEALAVFAFARLVTAIPITPGGVGIVEVALITGLSAAGGARSQVAAAVLVFRALTYVLPIPLGLGAYVFWRRNSSWRRAPNAAPRTELVPESA